MNSNAGRNAEDGVDGDSSVLNEVEPAFVGATAVTGGAVGMLNLNGSGGVRGPPSPFSPSTTTGEAGLEGLWASCASADKKDETEMGKPLDCILSNTCDMTFCAGTML